MLLLFQPLPLISLPQTRPFPPFDTQTHREQGVLCWLISVVLTLTCALLNLPAAISHARCPVHAHQTLPMLLGSEPHPAPRPHGKSYLSEGAGQRQGWDPAPGAAGMGLEQGRRLLPPQGSYQQLPGAPACTLISAEVPVTRLGCPQVLLHTPPSSIPAAGMEHPTGCLHWDECGYPKSWYPNTKEIRMGSTRRGAGEPNP